ncbi:TPA: hypothetical protein DCY43_03775 [candidate division WWE3 bacterium]|uniref:Uncharacterized protein n=3 Tax=Katanobacteria TaxID=422282 RepID=A0A0G1KKM3_UNCKA|nr:MAG: hypothetical protein UW82_C0028G0005 [candidate division WWE3 bacterium GW2011_GWC2_44_9]OGC53207.1 MAG: hypothetical protein A2709_02605 [candidate division WWE3 bacterium RIFCSPHIGHO2_01_FULL_43_9]HAZ29830.1 hypothetical protein [candidate division WWE3 bacterium]
MSNLSDYSDFFLFLGGFLIIGGIIYLLFRRSLQNIFISEEELSKLNTSKELPDIKVPFYASPKNNALLLGIIIGGFLFNQFLMWRMGSSGILNGQVISFGKKLFPISIELTKK